MIEFFHSYVPSSVAFILGPITIHWYGLIATIGLIAAWLIISLLSKKHGISHDLFNLYFGVAVSSLVGARIYHVINELPFYTEYPELILQVWNGGLAFHGGLIAGFLYAFFWMQKKHLSFLRIADIFAPGVILFQAIGRWGNYFNQELFGKPTDAAWGIPIVMSNRPEVYKTYEYFHPTFLYESILNIAIFLFLMFLHRGVLRGTIELKEGAIFFTYILLYSIVRFTLEFIRVDMTPIIQGIRLPHIVSVLLILVSLFFIFKLRIHVSKVS